MPRSDIQRDVRRLLEQVGLNPEHVNRFPHEFSGGQRQRIGIARALAVRPSLIVLDEPVSALDVSVQAQVINLLSDLQQAYQLAYNYIAHNLAVVRHVSDRIVVMYLGKIVELSPAERAVPQSAAPVHLSAALGHPCPRAAGPGGARVTAEGEPPNPLQPPQGCRFHPRCPRASEVCRTTEPPLTAYDGGHLAACHHPLNLEADKLASATRSELSALSAGHVAPTIR